MKKVIFWTSLIALFFCLFETAILSHIQIFTAWPEFILILVIYIAIHNGTAIGTSCGFISGLLLDLMSLSPIGLHSFLFTLIGYIIGILHRKYNLNKIIIPATLTLISIGLKVLIVFVLSIFGKNIIIYDISKWQFWMQTGVTVIFAPIEFAILNLFLTALKAEEF
ncbi:MAG: rod shape-determining protein MreD [Treponema sp.]|nr:MAG: rod shape-determining protein MreD [Treponema sp.]